MNESKDILLITPPSGLYRRDDRCQSRVEDQTVNVIFPPMELASYAAVARAAGWMAAIRDYPAMGAGWDDCRRDIEARRPAVLLINSTSATARADIETARIAKAVRPEALAIARGEYLRYEAREILLGQSALDLIVWGEVEAIMPELLRAAMEGKETLRGTAGVAFVEEEKGVKGGKSVKGLKGDEDENENENENEDEDEEKTGRVYVAEERPMVGDLDALPLPARDLLDNGLYVSPETGNPLTVIQGNRGCPSKCVFCPAGAMSGYRARFRSPAGVVAELKECVERHGIREFLFNGDTFTIKKSWVIELCRLICKARLDIRWGCNSRVDTFDDERAEWMKKAGCWVVAFGVESGSQTMLDRMGKNAAAGKAFDAVRAARRAGLLAHTFYIIGLPWETRATLAETLAFARRLDADFFDFNVAYPLPGTELWEIARRDNLFEGPTPTESSYAQAALRTYELSGAELTRWRRKALLRMYLRPRYIWRTLARVRSWRVLRNYLRAAVRRLGALLRG